MTSKDSEDLTVACSDINTSCVLRESQVSVYRVGFRVYLTSSSSSSALGTSFPIVLIVK